MIGLPPYLLFDLDDTLLEFNATGDVCWKNLCAEYAPRIGLEAADLLATIERRRGWYWSSMERHQRGRMHPGEARREIVRLAFDDLHLEWPEIARELADAFTVQREALVRPFPGALETLSELSGRGIRMALITNGLAQFQRAKIQRFGLAQFFDPILIESEFGVGKPDPRPFLHALSCLEATPQEAWMVGDALEYDIRPAQALGIGTVWVDQAGKGLALGSNVVPKRIIRAVWELCDQAGEGGEA